MNKQNCDQNILNLKPTIKDLIHLVKLCVFGILVAMTLSLASCLTVQKVNTALEQPHIDIQAVGSIAKPFPRISLPAGIEVDSVLYPSGFASQSYATRAGILILPLLIYNRFQTNYSTVLGAKQFDQPINEGFRERFRALLTTCEDSTTHLKDRYTITMDLQSCQAQGIYVHGSWSAFYIYGAVNGIIDHGRNASSFVRIRWYLSKGNESIIGGNVMVTLKDSYLGPVNGFLTNNNERKELSQPDLNMGIGFQTEIGNDPHLNIQHINKMVQVLCLGFDKATEIILTDIQQYFQEEKKLGN